MGKSMESKIRDLKIRELFVELDARVGETLYVEHSIVVGTNLYEEGLRLVRGRLESYSVTYREYDRLLILNLSGATYTVGLSGHSRVRLSTTGPSFEDSFFIFEGADRASEKSSLAE